MLQLIAQAGLDIKGLAVDAVIVIAVIVVIGILLSIPVVQKYTSWVPEWAKALLALVVVVVCVLWALGKI